MALSRAISDIESGNNYPIPETIRISSSIYKYPHNYKGSYVKQQYLPDNLINRKYYEAKNTSKFEKALNDIYLKIEEVNKKTE